MDSFEKQRAELVKRLNQTKATGTLIRAAAVPPRQTTKEDVRKLAAIRQAHDKKSRTEATQESLSVHS